MRNQQGLSIVEVLVASGLALAVSLGVMKMNQTGMKGASAVSSKLSLSMWQANELERKLSDPGICIHNFGSADPTQANTYTQLVHEDDTPFLQAGEMIESTNGAWRVANTNPITLQAFIPDSAGSSRGACNLDIQLENTKKNYAADRRLRVLMTCTLNAAGDAYEACAASGGGGSGGLWSQQLGGGGSPEYIFRNGNVFIGPGAQTVTAPFQIDIPGTGQDWGEANSDITALARIVGDRNALVFDNVGFWQEPGGCMAWGHVDGGPLERTNYFCGNRAAISSVSSSITGEGSVALASTGATLGGDFSVSVGQNNDVEGNNSLSVGSLNQVNGFNSIAAGSGNTLMGSSSIVLGDGNNVSVGNSLISGANNTARTPDAGHPNYLQAGNTSRVFISGNNNLVMGENTTALGTQNQILGKNSFVAGNSNNIQSGENVYIIGRENTGGGDNSIMLGMNLAAEGENNIIMGKGGSSSVDKVMILGFSDAGFGPTETETFTAVFNNGYVFHSDPTDLATETKNLYFDKEGRLGVGVDINANTGGGYQPKFMVKGNTRLKGSRNEIGETATASSADATAIGVNVSASHAGAVIIGNGGGASTQAANATTIVGTGGVYACADSACANGAYIPAGATGWSNHSDRNLKENFVQLDREDFIERFSELDITLWNYKTRKNKNNIGPMAQDFNRLFANIFNLQSDNKGISNKDIRGVTMVTVQGLIDRTETLQKENDELKAKLKDIEAKLDRLLHQ